MTHEQFTEYCIQNKPSCIVPHEWGFFKIAFENREYINIGSGIDGLIYTHQSEVVKTDTTMLLKDLQCIIPNFFPELMEKYGDTVVDPIRGRLYKDGKVIYDVMKDKPSDEAI